MSKNKVKLDPESKYLEDYLFFESPCLYDFTHKQLVDYEGISEFVSWGRRNPVHFCEEIFGVEMLDYQKYIFMNTWLAQNAVWLMSRNGGKSILGAIYLQTRALLVPSVPNVGYKIPKVIENTKLYSDEVCNSQAQYETYQTTAKQDTISLTMMIIPFIEPTQKFKYTSLNSGETDEWIIKSFSWSTLEGTMTVELYRFLQDYSYVYNNS